MQKYYDVAIVGGGAAGLMAALSCAAFHTKAKIVVLEKMEKCGRKIRITGKGRCNLTNNKGYEEFLSKVRSEKDFFEHSFKEFDNEDTWHFFQDNGLKLVVKQGGRIYPMSEDAWDVVRCLENNCYRSDVDIECNCEINKIVKTESGFDLFLSGRASALKASKVILATGGKSYPKTGSTGDGYAFAKELGHTITPLLPSLVPFDIKSKFLSQVRGLVVKNINISLEIDSQIIAKEQGEAEFFSFGIGGGSIFRMSRLAVEALSKKQHVYFVIDFKPGLTQNKFLGRMDRECAENPKLTLETFFRKLFPQKLIQMILSEITQNKNVLLSSLDERQKIEVINIIKNFKLQVLRDRGFAEAVVTAGGVDCTEVEPKTLKSNICDGLSFAGELLNIDADTGGYNLQIAFSTGFCAGKYIL